ncbi:MAG: 50S ribosomal protein L4 [Candidatus Promineifilaceae bacterium]|nr:50S ribosomal protein L4 [Candidatus Promineifilaceae bacterium]
MKVAVLDMAGAEVGTVELPPSIFEARVNRDLMHQALVRQLANARRGTHKAQSRSEVNRTGGKWYRQKGTGRARHGSKRAPIFVGGGVAHGPRPRSYRKDMPRKMRRAALCSALTVKAAAEEIIVLDELTLERPKTKEMHQLMQRLTGGDSTLVVVADRDDNVELSARNLADVKTLRATYLNIRDLLGYNKIVVALDALDVIEGYLAKDSGGFSAEFAGLALDEEE